MGPGRGQARTYDTGSPCHLTSPRGRSAARALAPAGFVRAPTYTLTPVQAVVLVGGEGTRLRPLTLETPKPMVPVMNVPFLERTLRRLKEAGIDDVILPAGYLPEAITSYFGTRSHLRHTI